MAKRFIMTAFAQDRIGVVADITKIIYDSGCNLEDSEMTQLEDEFVLMLIFAGDKDGLEAQLSADCRRLEREKSITAFVRELGEEVKKPPAPYTKHHIHAEGLDHAGIIYKISEFFARNSCNILELHSRQRQSPKSGTPLYTVEIDVEVPDALSMDDLEQGLDDLSHEIHIDFFLDKDH